MENLEYAASGMAQSVIKLGIFDDVAFQKHYGNGLSNEGNQFGFSYAKDLADWTVRGLSDDNVAAIAHRFSVGCSELTQVHFAYALNYLNVGLSKKDRSLVSDFKSAVAKELVEDQRTVFERILPIDRVRGLTA